MPKRIYCFRIIKVLQLNYALANVIIYLNNQSIARTNYQFCSYFLR